MCRPFVADPERLSEETRDLLDKTLCPDPKKRITANKLNDLCSSCGLAPLLTSPEKSPAARIRARKGLTLSLSNSNSAASPMGLNQAHTPGASTSVLTPSTAVTPAATDGKPNLRSPIMGSVGAREPRTPTHRKATGTGSDFESLPHYLSPKAANQQQQQRPLGHGGATLGPAGRLTRAHTFSSFPSIT